ncbi:MAG: transglycosylase SLT domain-containing protein [Acidobacteriia bacterium]|nr:transglycosylase SLT domain-containing protein [Terriglobia bacterium]
MQLHQLKSEPIYPESPKVPGTGRLLIRVVVFFLVASSVAAVKDTRNASAQLSATLDPLSYKYSSVLQATLGAFGTGMGNFSSGLFAAAAAAFPDLSAAASTAVADYILLYKARACLELGKGKEALDLFRALQSQYPDSPVLAQAIQGQSQALLILHDPTAALGTLDSAQVKEDAGVSCLRGQALEAWGKGAEAARIYLHIFTDHVDSGEADFAERRLRALSPAFLTKAENREMLVRRSENLIRAGRSLEARTLLLKLESARLPGPGEGKIYLLLSDADTNLRRLTEALRYLRRVTDPNLAAQANYLEGVCYRGLGNEAGFLKTRDRALQLFPQSPFTEKLLYSVATYYDVDNKIEAAREAYQAIARGFPKGEYIERSLWKLALYSYSGKHYEEALNGFWQYLQANPSPGAASAPAYWMGRCFENLGDPDKAASLYGRVQFLANNSYYGQRAREALAAMVSPSPTTTLAPTTIDFAQVSRKLDTILPEPATIPEPSAATLRVIERARQLVAAGLLDLALVELERGYAGHGGNDKVLCYGMSRIYQSKDNFFGAISTLRRAFPDYLDLPSASLPDEVWDILFPVRHFNLVAQHALRNHLDPDLVLALIRQESAFQESARSKANARGLMQVLPSTGRILAREAGIARYTVSRLYNPETNVALGTRYLASLLQRYGGKVELALAAYNAGDNRVDRWLQEFGDVNVAEFVERIPFSETRGYVKQVISNRAHYHLRTAPSSGLAPGLEKDAK